MDTTILMTYAEKALQWVENTASFVAGEVPIYIEELLSWKMTESLINMGICILVMVPLIVIGVMAVKKAKKVLNKEGYNSYDDGDEVFMYGLVGGILLLGASGSLFVSLGYLKDVVYIMTAPRVYLIEYLGELLG